MNAIGVVLIEFSEEMDTDVPLEYFNETSMNITVLPSNGRQYDETFDPSAISIKKWTATKFENKTFEMEMIFDKPEEISPDRI